MDINFGIINFYEDNFDLDVSLFSTFTSILSVGFGLLSVLKNPNIQVGKLSLSFYTRIERILILANETEIAVLIRYSWKYYLSFWVFTSTDFVMRAGKRLMRKMFTMIVLRSSCMVSHYRGPSSG